MWDQYPQLSESPRLSEVLRGSLRFSAPRLVDLHLVLKEVEQLIMNVLPLVIYSTCAFTPLVHWQMRLLLFYVEAELATHLV